MIPRSKVVAVGKNYADHAKEMGGEVPATPLLFFKPNTAVVGPDDPVVLPEFTREVSYEAELAVVISKVTKDVEPENVRSYVLGYTVANDVTARDAQRTDGQWARAKGFDTSCPLGPWIDTDLNPPRTSPCAPASTASSSRTAARRTWSSTCRSSCRTSARR